MNSCFDCSSGENIRTVIWRFCPARLTTDGESERVLRLGDPSGWDVAFDRECTRDIDQQWYSQTDPTRWRSLRPCSSWWMRIALSNVKQTSHSTWYRCIRAYSADDPIGTGVDDCWCHRSKRRYVSSQESKHPSRERNSTKRFASLLLVNSVVRLCFVLIMTEEKKERKRKDDYDDYSSNTLIYEQVGVFLFAFLV